jgi:hypothetical protein
MPRAARLIRVGVLAATALVGISATAAAPPALVLDATSVSASWRESWLTGSVRFSGTVGAAAQLNASLRPAGRPGPQAAKVQLSAGADGRFSGQLKLPARLRPGSYLIRVWGTSGTATLTPVEREVTVPAPREGVVDRAYASATKTGAATVSVSGPRRELWAHFHFVVRPRSGRVTASWYTPSFTWVGTVTRTYRADFETFVRAPTGLQRGRWWCVLKSSGRVVKRVRVRIT